MKSIDLVGFIEKTESKYRWDGNEVYLSIYFWDIKEFVEFFSESPFLANRDTKIVIKDHYFIFGMAEICEYFDIELESVFGRSIDYCNGHDEHPEKQLPFDSSDHELLLGAKIREKLDKNISGLCIEVRSDGITVGKWDIDYGNLSINCEYFNEVLKKWMPCVKQNGTTK
jgi:hypothetical protein